MSIVFRSAAATEETADSTWENIVFPTGWQPGDFCLLGFAQGGDRTPTGLSPDWTLVQEGLSGGSDTEGYVYYRFLQSGDVPPIISGMATSSGPIITACYTGVDPATPILNSNENAGGSSTTSSTPALTTSGPSKIVSMIFVDAGGLGDGDFFVAGSGFTERVELMDVTDFVVGALADMDEPSAITAQTYSVWTLDVADTKYHVAMALNPASGATGLGNVAELNAPQPLTRRKIVHL